MKCSCNSNGSGFGGNGFPLWADGSSKVTEDKTNHEENKVAVTAIGGCLVVFGVLFVIMGLAACLLLLAAMVKGLWFVINA